MFSGTCKKEVGAQHAKLIKRSSQQVRTRIETPWNHLRTFASHQTGINSARDALVRLTMILSLPNSPIYEQLIGSWAQNLLVGPENNSDKILSIFQTPAQSMMRTRESSLRVLCHTLHFVYHLLQRCLFMRLRALLNPNDRQVLYLVFLLKEIWSLPAAAAGSDPGLCGPVKLYMFWTIRAQSHDPYYEFLMKLNSFFNPGTAKNSVWPFLCVCFSHVISSMQPLQKLLTLLTVGLKLAETRILSKKGNFFSGYWLLVA